MYVSLSWFVIHDSRYPHVGRCLRFGDNHSISCLSGWRLTSTTPEITVKLQREKRHDNWIVLVKSYHSMRSPQKTDIVSPLVSRFNTFSQCLSFCKTSLFTRKLCEGWMAGSNYRGWSFLCLQGTFDLAPHRSEQSHSHDSLSSRKGWVRWTVTLNPMEMIYGLYDMVRRYIHEFVLLIPLLYQRTSLIVCHICSCSYR